ERGDELGELGSHLGSARSEGRRCRQPPIPLLQMGQNAVAAEGVVLRRQRRRRQGSADRGRFGGSGGIEHGGGAVDEGARAGGIAAGAGIEFLESLVNAGE